MSQDITISQYMNNQVSAEAVIDYVEAKLIEQGKPSIDEDGDCMYRDPSGSKCAAGWLIPDELYTSDMDSETSNAIRAVMIRHRKSLGITGDIGGEGETSSPKTAFLSQLQGAHDSAARNTYRLGLSFVDELKERMNVLRVTAKLY